MKPTINELIEGLNQIPETIALTPVGGNKRPYRKNWQKEPPITREEIISDITKGVAKGYGIRLGEISGGIVAIDQDGDAAGDLAGELSTGDNPKTIGFTSGKPGRRQQLYKIPEQYWKAIKSKKINTNRTGDDGKPILLEFRWNGLQSVLPPSCHPETGSYYYLSGCSFSDCFIADAPMWVIEQMLETPAPTPKTESTRQYDRQPFTEDDYLDALFHIPLAAHDSYDDWLKIGMACHAAGLQCEDWDKWSQGSPSYKPNGCWNAWKHFKGNGGITAGTLIFLAQQNGWRRRHEQPQPRISNSGSSPSSNKTATSKKHTKTPNSKTNNDTELNEADLISAIDDLISKNLTFDRLYFQVLGLAKISDFSENQILKIYDSRLNTAERETILPDIKSEIEEIIKARDTSINLSDFISPNLAWRLKALGRELNVKPEVFLCCLLTAMSALYRVGTKITLWRATGFRVSPNLFGAIVAESSQKKSPIIKNIITKPFKQLRQRTRDEYDYAKEEFDKNIAYYKSLKGEEQVGAFPEGPPQAPRKRQHLFSKATGESIYSQFENFPTQGMCYLVDELAGLFKSLNQYRGGKGSDEEDLLSLYDGEGATVLRTDGTRVDLDDTLLSIFGSIQPGVLGKLRQDATDANGKWARFLFVNQPLAAATLSESDSDEEILGNLLEKIYLAIDDLPEMQFHLDSEAKRLFKHYYAELEKRRIEHSNPAIRTIIGKTIGRIGKIAINLHCLNAICENQEITEKINRQTLQSAVNLSLWFAQQAIYTISLLEEPDDNNLAPHLVKVLEIAERKEIVKARDVANTYTAKYRPTASTIRGWFLDLAQMGFGTTKGNGTRLGFVLKNNNGPDGNGGHSPGGGNVDPSTPPTLPTLPTKQPQNFAVPSSETPTVLPTVLPSNAVNAVNTAIEETVGKTETNFKENITAPDITPNYPQKCGQNETVGKSVGKSVGVSNVDIPSSQPKCGQCGQPPTITITNDVSLISLKEPPEEIDHYEANGLTPEDVAELERLAYDDNYFKIGQKIKVVAGEFKNRIGEVAAKCGEKLWCVLEDDRYYRLPETKIPLEKNVLCKI